MPQVTDTCSTLVGQCVSVLFRADHCLNPATPSPAPMISGFVRNKGTTPCDPNGAFLVNNGVSTVPGCGPVAGLVQTYTNDNLQTVAINGCDYYKLNTCVIPASVDSAPTDGVIRHLEGAEYILCLTVNNQKFGSWPIVIDAAADYSPIEDADGCLPIKDLLGSNPDTIDACSPEALQALANTIAA